MSYELCTSGAIARKAGANANTYASTSNAILLEFYNQAVGWINSETRFDWSTNYASVGVQYSGALADVCSSKAAMALINYDMSGYTSRAEAQTMLDINWDIVKRGIAFLKDEKVKTAMGV